MVTAKDSATDGGAATQRVTYVYDAFGNRIENDTWDGTTTTTQRYGMDGWNPAKPSAVGNENFDTWAQLDGTNALVRRRETGVNANEQIARQTPGGVVNWYLTDRQGSVTQVIDNAGSVVASSTFDGFGNLVTGSLSDRFGFQGMEFDGVVGDYFDRARVYDPGVGQFTSQDVKFPETGANAFEYAGNGPTNGIDPSGQTLFLPDAEANNWVSTSGNTLQAVSVGNGFSKLVVSDAARQGNKVYEALSGLIPTGINKHETMVALFDGDLRGALPSFNHSMFDRLLVPNLNDLKLQASPVTYTYPLVLNPNTPQLLPGIAIYPYQWTGSNPNSVAMSVGGSTDESLRMIAPRRFGERPAPSGDKLFVDALLKTGPEGAQAVQALAKHVGPQLDRALSGLLEQAGTALTLAGVAGEFAVGIFTPPVGWLFVVHSVDRGTALILSPKGDRQMGLGASTLDWVSKETGLNLSKENVFLVDDLAGDLGSGGYSLAYNGVKYLKAVNAARRAEIAAGGARAAASGSQPLLSTQQLHSLAVEEYAGRVLLSEMNTAKTLKAELGPAVSIAQDKVTGRVSKVYFNNQQGGLPSNLSDPIATRLNSVPKFVKTKGPGSHAEVYAVDELLQARPGAKLSDIQVLTLEIDPFSKHPLLSVKPPCIQCDHLLNGVEYLK